MFVFLHVGWLRPLCRFVLASPRLRQSVLRRAADCRLWLCRARFSGSVGGCVLPSSSALLCCFVDCYEVTVHPSSSFRACHRVHAVPLVCCASALCLPAFASQDSIQSGQPRLSRYHVSVFRLPC
uniref:Secreted protein n=1 Tax=Arundo donax TaxID=35708 RepID=A0A0A9BQU6_ARUDO